MAELVELQLGRVFRQFRGDMERLRDSIALGGQPIIRREWASSVRQRFYRSGAGLQSAVDEFQTDGDKRTYRLFPTAFYMKFGEYGTGQRGAATGLPAPRGYSYGDKPGMAARRFTRIATLIAKPQVDAMALGKVKQFAAAMTTN